MSELNMTLNISHLSELEGLALASGSVPCPAAVVEAGDMHIMEAVVKARRSGLIAPIAIGREEDIRDVLKKLDEDEKYYTIEPAETPEQSAFRAAQLVRAGQARIIIKGLIETAVLMRQMINKETGILTPGRIVSSVAVIESPKYHKLFAMTDMGINTFPDVERKVGIINNAVAIMHAVGVETPKVAVLSSIERVNPKQIDTVEAAEIKAMNERGEIKGCLVEGPIALDLAVRKDAAEIKKYESPVAGDADVLVVPNILCANMLIKGIGIFGEMDTADIVVGCDVPIVFGSRGGPVEAKYNSIALCVLASGG